MIKTMAMAICTMMTVMFGMANMAGATPYSVTKNWSFWEGNSAGTGARIWNFITLDNSRITPDTVSNPRLTFRVTGVDGNNDMVTVGTSNQTLLEGSHVNVFENISDVFTTLNVSGVNNFPLDVSLFYSDPYDTSKPDWQGLWLQSSRSSFDLTDVTAEVNGDSNAPVPVPAALLLLGSGLSGLALWGKRRRVTE